jgi:hypothetical protein
MANEESSFTEMRLAESQSGLIAAHLLTEGFGRQHPLTLAPGRSGDWDTKKRHESFRGVWDGLKLACQRPMLR